MLRVTQGHCKRNH